MKNKKGILKGILIGITAVFISELVSCGIEKGQAINTQSNYINLKCIETINDNDTHIYSKVYVDKDTKIMYLWFADRHIDGQTMTPILDDEGKPRKYQNTLD